MGSRNWASIQVNIYRWTFHTCDKVRRSERETLFDNHYHVNIFYVWEHYFVLKVLPCFFHFSWKCLWKVEVYLLVRLNLSRLSIIHSRSKFNFRKLFKISTERTYWSDEVSRFPSTFKSKMPKSKSRTWKRNKQTFQVKVLLLSFIRSFVIFRKSEINCKCLSC